MKIKKRKKHWKEKNTGRREGGKEGRKKKDASNQNHAFWLLRLGPLSSGQTQCLLSGF